MDDDDIDELLHKNCPIYTVGFLLKEDLNGVSLGSEWIEQDHNFRNTTYIPAALVTSIHRLTRSKKVYQSSPAFDAGLGTAPLV